MWRWVAEVAMTTNLGIVLGVTSMQSDRLEIQSTVEVDSGDDVSIWKRDKGGGG